MSDKHHGSAPPTSKEALSAGHEVEEIHPKPIVIGLIGLIVFSAASFAVVVVLFNFMAGEASQKSAKPSPLNSDRAIRQAPEPRLQTDAWGDWDRYKASQDQVLSRYSWVDKESLLVRVPVSRAMEIVLERGLPSRPGPMPLPQAGGSDLPDAGGRMAPSGSLQMNPPPSATEPAHGTTGGGHP
ncbi:MAG: hypothetical protein FD129_2716 [bacterium]|nr:MAG: hypothetical protein FD129_2716 [bacterium]